MKSVSTRTMTYDCPRHGKVELDYQSRSVAGWGPSDFEAFDRLQELHEDCE